MLWVEFDPQFDSVRLNHELRRDNVQVAAGNIFSASGKYRNCIRMNYSNRDLPLIEAACARSAPAPGGSPPSCASSRPSRCRPEERNIYPQPGAAAWPRPAVQQFLCRAPALTSLTLGPLAIPLPHVLLYLGFFGALLAGWLAGRRRGANPKVRCSPCSSAACWRHGWHSLRAMPSSTRQRPLSIVDIRDGGFLALPGVIAAALIGAVLAWRRAALRRPRWPSPPWSAYAYGAAARR